jgi:transposase
VKKFFIGIDVSKPFFDSSILVVIDHVKQKIQTKRFDNTKEGLKEFEKWLKSFEVTFEKHTLLVIENTGIYHRLLWQFSNKKNLPIHIGNAAHIKWSFGIARGKNDKIDSIRLCNYAFKEADVLQSAPILSPEILQLKDLWTARRKLLSQLTSMKTYLKELKGVSEKASQDIIEKAHKQALNGMSKSLKDLEAQIARIIKENKEIKQNYNLLLSVPGIGQWTATYLICCTHNFASKVTGKQLACYAGVAPFGHTSGISIRGKDKVHKMANKELKKLLYLGAMSVINHNKEFGTYYQRKLNEGKEAMSIINAVKNKILLRAAAVVNKGIPYVDNSKIAA